MHICTPNIELAVVNMRPFFLPREFSNVFLITVYIAPDANYDMSIEILESTLTELIRRKPSALIIFAGDFNRCDADSAFPHFFQYVNKPTRGEAILDKLYCNAAHAYNCDTSAGLGKSDHRLVYMSPTYTRQAKKDKLVKKEITRLSEDGADQLDCIFLTTDWDVFIQSSEDLHSLTDTISSYIVFCYELCCEKKVVKFFNNQPWYTNSVRAACSKMRKSYGTNDFNHYRYVYRRAIKQAKDDYRTHLESQLSSNNVRNTWNCMKQIMNTNPVSTPEVLNSPNAPNCLNEYFTRFENEFNNEEVSKCRTSINRCASPINTVEFFNADQVSSVLSRVNQNKSTGPDGIPAKVIKNVRIV